MGKYTNEFIEKSMKELVFYDNFTAKTAWEFVRAMILSSMHPFTKYEFGDDA